MISDRRCARQTRSMQAHAALTGVGDNTAADIETLIRDAPMLEASDIAISSPRSPGHAAAVETPTGAGTTLRREAPPVVAQQMIRRFGRSNEILTADDITGEPR